MVKRFKSVAEKGGSEKQLASAVKESAQQIWLAGLGAFAKAQEEGQKVFDALVKEGASLQKRTVAATEQTVSEVTGKVGKVTEGLQKQANGTWDKLEGVFEERVARALGRLGVPTKREIADLVARIDALGESIEALGGKAAAKRPARPRKSATRRTTTRPAAAD